MPGLAMALFRSGQGLLSQRASPRRSSLSWIVLARAAEPPDTARAASARASVLAGCMVCSLVVGLPEERGAGARINHRGRRLIRTLNSALFALDRARDLDARRRVELPEDVP